MDYKELHRWDLTPKEAIALQKKLQKKIIIKPFNLKNLKTAAGIDVSVKEGLSKAAVVVLSFPDMEVLESSFFTTETVFPYIPGLLSFREGPVILECIKKLKITPEVFIFDGQGLAHPRGMGLASHIGIILDKPSIGSAKSHLYGTFTPPGKKRGDFSLMEDSNGTSIGAVLRTRAGIKPVFVSPGHLMDTASAVKVIMASSGRYKIPEPIRAAHKAASLVKQHTDSSSSS